ncbi:hypothetical protein KUV59_09180 [Marinobacter daepoensis]|uniref:hypothetical protein n=1 Tax=Marinobacter daepoensis TaxID=262077 RepID=UPI001C94BB4E|nr:hypothetical protein [Marinobacter daepoensis]MBY6033340.1 hypothetical protein [Marinobacter daepoensis]
MENFKKWALTAAISSTVALTGCGGGSSSSSDAASKPTPPDSTNATGVFVDSAVAGINYSTSPSGQQGQTNSVGEYEYQPGDTVTFSIGGISLPPVKATGRITPADMGSGAADWSQDPAVINILRLLQTLDNDSNPANGITITPAVHTALKDVAIDTTLSESDFETQANTALGETLIPKTVAIDHFQTSQTGDLTGSWVFVEDGGNVNVLTFFNGSEYLIVHSKADDDQQRAGTGEYGTYEWNSITGELNLSVIGNSDGSGGLADNNETATWSMRLVNGGLVLLSAPNNEEVVFEPVRNDRNSLVGSWYIGDGSLDGQGFHNILTILDDSTYVVAHNANEEAYEGSPVAVSSEWGSYSFDGENFAVTNVTVDLDGPGGLFDNPANNGDGPVNGPALLRPTGELTLTDNANSQDTFTLMRLGRYVVELRDFEGDTKPVYVEASLYPGSDIPASIYFTFSDLVDPGEEGLYDLEFSSSEIITVDMRTENGNRSGRMQFDSSGEDNVAGTWDVSTSGALVFTETDGTSGDFGHWRFLMLADGQNLVHLDGVADLELRFVTELSFQ